MRNNDELLQEKLNALEQGAGLDPILASLPPEARDLEPLLRLAAAVRELPHPEPALNLGSYVTPQPSAVPSNGRTATTRPLPGQVPAARRQAQPGARKPLFPRWAWAPALAGVFVLAIFAVVAVLGAGFYLSGPRGSNTAVLMDAIGRVEIASGPGAEDWRPVETGDRIRAGQRLRTRAASGVTLVFFDGTRTAVGPGADLAFSDLDGGWGDVLQVEIDQAAGRTSHSVVPLRGDTSKFIVHTPSGDATVHGTTFNVAVAQGGKARFAVDTGQVQVANAAAEVFLTAGQVTAALPGAGPEEPNYAFTLQGEVTARQGSTWMVQSIPFTVLDTTAVSGDPKKGDQVHVEGRVLPEGEWVADTIETAPDETQTSSFTGVVQAMDGDQWIIGGWPLTVNAETQVDAGVEIGSAVRVSVTLQADGAWVAAAIVSLAERQDEPTVTVTPDPDAQPVLVFGPDDLEAEGCGVTTHTFSANLANQGNDAADVAANVALGYSIVDGADFVESISLAPMTWDSLAPGESAAFDLAVTLNSGWAGAPDGTQVKLSVFVAQETNRPGEHTDTLTAVITADCGIAATEEPTTTDEPTATPTPTGTETPTVTETPVITPTGTLTATVPVTPTETLEPTVTPTPGPTLDPAASVCTGAQPHPKGTSLAQKYGVPYEEIMSWFCQGFGFGEIDLAYGLSLETGIPVDQIFAMKSSGLGWGEIKQQLTPKVKPKDAPQLTPQPGGDQQQPGNGNSNNPGKPDNPGSTKPKKK